MVGIKICRVGEFNLEDSSINENEYTLKILDRFSSQVRTFAKIKHLPAMHLVTWKVYFSG